MGGQQTSTPVELGSELLAKFLQELTCYILLDVLHPARDNALRVNSALADSEKSGEAFYAVSHIQST